MSPTLCSHISTIPLFFHPVHHFLLLSFLFFSLTPFIIACAPEGNYKEFQTAVLETWDSPPIIILQINCCGLKWTHTLRSAGQLKVITGENSTRTHMHVYAHMHASAHIRLQMEHIQQTRLHTYRGRSRRNTETNEHIPTCDHGNLRTWKWETIE